jgi:hypothetical protein
MRAPVIVLSIAAILSPLAAVGIGAFTAATAGEPTGHGWALQQRGKHLGNEKLLISSEGFRWTASSTGFSIAMLAKDGQVTCINDTNQRYIKMTMDDWTKFVRGRNDPSFHPKVKKGKRGVVAGIPCTQYFIELRAAGDFGFNAMLGRPSKTMVMKMLDQLDTPEKREKLLQQSKLKSSEFWVADNIDIDPEFGRLMAQPLGLPNSMGLILKMVEPDGTPDGFPVITTLKAERADIPLSTYSPPKNYKRVKNEIALLVEEDDVPNMPSIFADVSESYGGYSECIVKSRIAKN